MFHGKIYLGSIWLSPTITIFILCIGPEIIFSTLTGLVQERANIKDIIVFLIHDLGGTRQRATIHGSEFSKDPITMYEHLKDGRVLWPLQLKGPQKKP